MTEHPNHKCIVKLAVYKCVVQQLCFFQNDNNPRFKNSLGNLNEDENTNPPNRLNPPNPLNPPNSPSPLNPPSPTSLLHPLNPCPHPPNPRFKDSRNSKCKR